MRIVTRPDFDGIVCAVLLKEVFSIDVPIVWVEPGDIQNHRVPIKPGDILANLPYAPGCSLWFDHHHSNRMPETVPGLFRMAPSAAGLVFEYFRERYQRDFSELVQAADKIDSADLTMAEVFYPQAHPYLLLSMTLPGHSRREEAYWNHLVDLLRRLPIEAVLQDPLVKEHCDAVCSQNESYQQVLVSHTRCEAAVAVTDFRDFHPAPDGNRFLVYALFPQTNVHMKIRYDTRDPKLVAVSVGHSIFNKTCNVDVGTLLSHYQGGGHFTVGACRFPKEFADVYIPQILAALVENRDASVHDHR
ncbi:MAG: exopolyphosphatase [Thermodesulfobacteriota bacterium]